MGPTSTSREVASAREAALELVISDGEIPEGVRVHLKLDTGMGRWGSRELPEPSTEVVGLMSHLATADCDPEFTETQIGASARRRSRTAPDAAPGEQRRRAPLSDARFDAAVAGSRSTASRPSATTPGDDGLEPALRWSSLLAQVRQLRPGESTGYGRRFVAQRPTWIGIVPVGYADGFRRDLTGTEVRVEASARRVVGTISMDAFAVELDRELPAGTPVTLLGHGVMAEDHARVARHDQLRARLRDQQRSRPLQAGGRRFVSSSKSCSRARRPGSSAARFATRRSIGRSSTSTSPLPSRSGRLGATPAPPGARPFLSPSDTEPGGWRSTTAARSISRL
jgi:hypothetical protein